MTFEIAGEASFQHELQKLAGGRKTEQGVKLDMQAHLQPEPSNPTDANAIAVVIRNKKVGYLRREDAATFGSFLKQVGADTAICDARIVGGWDDGSGDDGHFGVKLSISWPPKIAH